MICSPDDHRGSHLERQVVLAPYELRGRMTAACRGRPQLQAGEEEMGVLIGSR